MRTLTISTTGGSEITTAIIAAIHANQALSRLNFIMNSQEDSEKDEVELATEISMLSDLEINAIASVFSSVASNSNSTFEFIAKSLDSPGIEICTLHPLKPVDIQVLRSFLKEMSRA